MQRGRTKVRHCQDYSDKNKFISSVTWTSISSAKSSFRFSKNALSESAGMTLFVDDYLLLYILAFLNTKVSDYILSVLNPTLNYTAGSIANLPIIVDNTKKSDIEVLAEDNISFAKIDWDAFETSWNFICHPLVRPVSTLSIAFTAWQDECTVRFAQLKANEEELNCIFINIYGLQDELTSEVEDKDVTVRLADKTRDVKSLLSYAVGCMFGRYSLNQEGLVFAGGNFEEVYWKYKGPVALDKNGNPIEEGCGYTGYSLAEYHYPRLRDADVSEMATSLLFEPDVDNVIPITDEEYLEDDIIARLCQWLKVVYGDDTLEENLDFIAQALGNKGNTSREVIRNYFLKDFYKDHCKIYQKRPIYWLFDSGKQNGFKALIYLHRYTPDTIGNLRIDYLHRMQRVYENETDRMQDTIEHSGNAREVAQATKRKEKLQKQLKECREYDEKISHLALTRIDLDLDDGVKMNYEKLQTARDGKKYAVLARI